MFNKEGRKYYNIFMTFLQKSENTLYQHKKYVSLDVFHPANMISHIDRKLDFCILDTESF